MIGAGLAGFAACVWLASFCCTAGQTFSRRRRTSWGAPGAVAMLALAHDQHGVKPWRGLFDDARRLAAEGFTVTPRLAGMIASTAPEAAQPDMAAYFTKPDGTRFVAGDRLAHDVL